MKIEERINDWLSKKGYKDKSGFLDNFRERFLVNHKYTKSELLSRLVEIDFVKNVDEAEKILPALLNTNFRKTEKTQERFFEISGMHLITRYQLREYYK